MTRPRLTVAGIVVTTLCLATQIRGIRIHLDARTLVPGTAPAVKEADDTGLLFGLNDTVVVFLRSEEVAPMHRDLIAALLEADEALARLPGIDGASVASLARVPVIEPSGETSATLARMLSRDRGTRWASRSDRDWSSARRRGINDGVLLGVDGRGVVVFAEVLVGADRAKLFCELRLLKSRIERTHAVQVHLGGTALAQADLGDAVAADLVRMIPVVAVVLGVLLAATYRSIGVPMIALFEAGVSIICGLGLMGLVGGSVFVTTLVFPVIIVAISVSDNVYCLEGYRRLSISRPLASNETVLFVAFARAWGSIRLTGITTACGLLSLALTSLEPLRAFGLLGAVTILISTLFTVTLVPALLTLVRPKVHGDTFARWLSETPVLFRFCEFSRTTVVAVAVVLSLLACVTVSRRLQIDDSWIGNLPEDSETARTAMLLDSDMAGSTTMDLVVDCGARKCVFEPDFLQRVVKFERSLVSLPYVGAVVGGGGRVAGVFNVLGERGFGGPSFLSSGDLRMPSEMDIERGVFLLSAVGDGRQHRYFDVEGRRVRVRLFIRQATFDRLNRIVRDSKRAAYAVFPENLSLQVVGDGWISVKTVEILVSGQLRSIPAALIADLLLISAFLGSVRAGLKCIAPVVFSVCVVFGVLSASNIAVGIATSVFASIAIGIGVDFCIHLTASLERADQCFGPRRNPLKQALAIAGPPIVISSVTLAAGFSVLALSQVRPTALLGMILALALLVCASASLAIGPALAASAKQPTRPRSL